MVEKLLWNKCVFLINKYFYLIFEFQDSCQKGWRLFSIIAAYFTCSEVLKPYLFKYLESSAYDKRRAYHGTALVCLFYDFFVKSIEFFFLILLFSMSRKIFKKWNSIWLMKILQITGMSSQFEKNFQIWWPKECSINWRNYCHQCWSKFKKANLQTTRR